MNNEIENEIKEMEEDQIEFEKKRKIEIRTCKNCGGEWELDVQLHKVLKELPFNPGNIEFCGDDCEIEYQTRPAGFKTPPAMGWE